MPVQDFDGDYSLVTSLNLSSGMFQQKYTPKKEPYNNQRLINFEDFV